MNFSKEIEFAWRIFLSLENDIQRSFEFVQPLLENNKNTTSGHYQKIIFSSCSEIDNLCRLMMDNWKFTPNRFQPKAKQWNINLYFKALKQKSVTTQIIDENIFLDYQLQVALEKEDIQPFSSWKDGDSPPWWTGYNKLKHGRSDSFEKANLENSIFAVSGLLVIIKMFAQIITFDGVFFSGTKLIHLSDMPRFGSSYTSKNGSPVINGGTF